jgi:GAF domain-containing protein
MTAPVRDLLREVLAACGGSGATYWEALADGRDLVARVDAAADPARLEGLRVPIDGSLVGMVLCTGMAMALGPDAAYHPAAREATGILTEAMAVAPVRIHGHTAGVLSTINPRGRALFSQEDLESLQRYAIQLGRLLEEAADAR